MSLHRTSPCSSLMYQHQEMLYAFFWVIPRRLNFICRRFGTLSVPSSWADSYEEWLGLRMLGYLCGKRFGSSQNFSRINTFSNPVILHTYPPMKMEQSVPKRRHIEFRRRRINQKKAHNIQNTVKVWYQESRNVLCKAIQLAYLKVYIYM